MRGKPLNLEAARRIADDQGGRCLSEAASGGSARLRWLCAQGHEFESTLASARTGRWCPHCAGKARVGIERLRKAASERLGECLSESIANNKSMAMFRCFEGHEWSARVDGVLRGSWCPACAKAPAPGDPEADA